VLTIVASQGQWLWRQDEATYDAMVGNWDYRPDPSVLIVAIDEGSLQRIGQWPWPRSVHARLLDRLTDAGAERVALDLMLSEPDRRDSRQDDALAAAIRRNGRVVLPVLAAPAAGDRMAEEMLPIPQIAASAAAIGHTDVEVDGDGVARGVYLHAGIGKAHWPALGWHWPACRRARCAACPTPTRRARPINGGATTTCACAMPDRPSGCRRCPTRTCSMATWTWRCCMAAASWSA
jgi:CHASE2 domain-containing sensor protein